MYKWSFYNFYIPVPEKNCYLLYNSFQNALFEIGWELGETIVRQTQSGTVDLNEIPQEYTEMLVDEKFIVDREKDEIGIVNHVKHRFFELNKEQQDSLGITLLVTNNCNLACIYCFEGMEKPVMKMGDDIFDEIYAFAEKKIREGLKKVHVGWYGGEPLLCPQLIEKYSERLIGLCDKNNVLYSASIITNGVNLTARNAAILEKARISNIQITLDGDREVHDRRRPFVHSSESSFDIIVENLRRLEGAPFSISIRINTDKQVFPSIEKLLQRLVDEDIWPRNKNVSLYLGFTCGSEHYQDSDLYTSPEFSEALLRFRELKVRLYNEWAEKNGKKPGRFKLHFPQISHNVCGTYNHDMSMVIDAAGNISKCWEHVNDPAVVVGHVSEGIENVLNSERYKSLTNTFTVPAECESCSIYPICDQDFCPDKNFAVGSKQRRCLWKHQLVPYLKGQYLMQLDQPEMIESFEEFELRATTGQPNGKGLPI